MVSGGGVGDGWWVGMGGVVWCGEVGGGMGLGWGGVGLGVCGCGGPGWVVGHIHPSISASVALSYYIYIHIYQYRYIDTWTYLLYVHSYIHTYYVAEFPFINPSIHRQQMGTSRRSPPSLSLSISIYQI